MSNAVARNPVLDAKPPMDLEMKAPGCLLRKGSPFFGPRPETLILLQVDLGSESLSETVPAMKIIWRNCAELKTTQLRWQIGIGATFFGQATSIPHPHRPKALKTLNLKGDVELGLRPGSGESDLLIAVGGEWDRTVSAAQELLSQLQKNGLVLRSAHVGHDSISARGNNGFIDGTSNLQELNLTEFSKCVFVQPEDDILFAGGSYLIFRKYEEDLEIWSDLPDFVQEHLIGRQKESGFFLNGSSEWTPAVWEVTSPHAHIRRANPRDIPTSHPDHWKERIYRRSIKFTERKQGSALRYGLLFIALVRDPDLQFTRIYNERLFPHEGQIDHFLSSGYLKPISSACYFLPTDKQLKELMLLIDEEE